MASFYKQSSTLIAESAPAALMKQKYFLSSKLNEEKKSRIENTSLSSDDDLRISFWILWPSEGIGPLSDLSLLNKRDLG